MSEKMGKCPFCNADRDNKTAEDDVEDLLKRVEANDAGAICELADKYLLQDCTKAIELYGRAADLGYMKAHYDLAGVYYKGGDLKKEKFHLEAAAMAGHEVARNNLGSMEANSGNMDRAVKHWTISASAGYYRAMHRLIACVENSIVSR
jgi:TPR repeat protein